MLGLEQQELDSLKRQHESKSAELAETQHRLLEERTELDRIITDVQRKEAELSKVKQVRIQGQFNDVLSSKVEKPLIKI